jgi:hypothetical protein
MDTSNPPVVLRRYLAETYREALAAYEADLQSMASAGWFPVAQSWGWDAIASAGFIFGGSSWKPGSGILAVTYRRDPAAAGS